MQILGCIIKKIVLGFFVLYAFNMIAINFNILIPINFITIFFVGFFDLPAIVTLIILKMWGM